MGSSCAPLHAFAQSDANKPDQACGSAQTQRTLSATFILTGRTYSMNATDLGVPVDGSRERLKLLTSPNAARSRCKKPSSTVGAMPLSEASTFSGGLSTGTGAGMATGGGAVVGRGTALCECIGGPGGASSGGGVASAGRAGAGAGGGASAGVGEGAGAGLGWPNELGTVVGKDEGT